VDVSGEGVAEVGRGALAVLPAVVAVLEVDGGAAGGRWRLKIEVAATRRGGDGGPEPQLGR
jgi:hypothetical protein